MQHVAKFTGTPLTSSSGRDEPYGSDRDADNIEAYVEREGVRHAQIELSGMRGKPEDKVLGWAYGSGEKLTIGSERVKHVNTLFQSGCLTRHHLQMAGLATAQIVLLPCR